MADKSTSDTKPDAKPDPDLIPFVGEITRFLETEAPTLIRNAIEGAGHTHSCLAGEVE